MQTYRQHTKQINIIQVYNHYVLNIIGIMDTYHKLLYDTYLSIIIQTFIDLLKLSSEDHRTTAQKI